MSQAFEFDDVALAAMDEVKAKFGAKTYAQVITKALALARVAARHADAENTITLLAPGPDGAEQKVILSA